MDRAGHACLKTVGTVYFLEQQGALTCGSLSAFIPYSVPPKMLPLLALNGPYHSARISASFGFKQTADSENVPHSKSCVSSITSTFCYSPTDAYNYTTSVSVSSGSMSLQVQDVCRGSLCVVVKQICSALGEVRS